MAAKSVPLTLVYGLRLLPSEEVEEVRDGEVALRNGHTAKVTLHIIEGASEQEIRSQLMRSLDAYFEFYPEV
jgi:hypothetical protein